MDLCPLVGDRTYSKRAVQPICAVQKLRCAVQDVLRARSFVGRSLSADVDGDEHDEQLIVATCDTDVGSGLADEELMFTSVDSIVGYRSTV